MSFRLNWTIKQFSNINGFSKHKAVLKSPWNFYIALILKFIPGIHKKPIYFEFRNGGRIKISEFMSIYIYNEIFVDGCYDNLPVKSNNPVVIEIGANTGFFVLRIKTTYPNAQVISFEPYPPNFSALLETITLNNIENVTPIQKAVSDRAGNIKLYIHPTNIGGHSIFMEHAGDNYVDVETTTIDSILSDYGISGCDLLKLDCEGAEYPILKSFTMQIADKVRNIIFEPTYDLYSFDEINLFLKELGYNIKTQNGLIVASREKM